MKAARPAIVLATAGLTFVACFGKPPQPGEHTSDARPHDGNGTDIDAPTIRVDAAIDAQGSGSGSSATCTAIRDDFGTLDPPCGASWGMPSNGQEMMRVGSALSMAPQNMNGSAECNSGTFAFTGSAGSTLEILQAVTTGTGGTTYFRVVSGGSYAGVQITSSGGGGVVNGVCTGSLSTTPMPFNSLTHRWWQMVPSGSSVNIQFRADLASNWTSLGTCGWGITPPTVTAKFGVNVGTAGGSAAVFDEFNESPCPPPP